MLRLEQNVYVAYTVYGVPYFGIVSKKKRSEAVVIIFCSPRKKRDTILSKMPLGRPRCVVSQNTTRPTPLCLSRTEECVGVPPLRRASAFDHWLHLLKAGRKMEVSRHVRSKAQVPEVIELSLAVPSLLLRSMFPSSHAPRVEIRTIYRACYFQLISVLASISMVRVSCLRYDDIPFWWFEHFSPQTMPQRKDM